MSDAAFPAFTIPGYATLGNASAVYRFQTPILDRQILDSISWNHGKHAWKFGGEFRAGANDEIRDRGSAGTFGISPLITDLPGVSGTGNALASFLLGRGQLGLRAGIRQDPVTGQLHGLLCAGRLAVTDRLTVNAGLRWEAELPRRVVGNKMNSFDPAAINPVSGTPGVVTFAGVNGVPERAFATDTNNFGPRVGFAYRLPGKHDTVVRGGGGIFYGPTVSNTIGDVASLGFSTSASYVVSQAELQSALRLRDGFPAISRPPLTAAFGAVAPGQTPNTAVGFFNPKQVAPISYQYNLNVQREVVAGSAGGGRIPRERQPPFDCQRSQPEPSGAATDGTGQCAVAPSLSAIQQRHLDQSFDRQFHLSRRLRPGGKALQRRLLLSWRTTRFPNSSTMSSQPTNTASRAAIWTPTIAGSIRA